MIKQKGMSFDHNFGYSFPLFSSLLKKREEEKKISVKQTFHTRFWTTYNLCELTTQVHKFQMWFFNQKSSFEHWFYRFLVYKNKSELKLFRVRVGDFII